MDREQWVQKQSQQRTSERRAGAVPARGCLVGAAGADLWGFGVVSGSGSGDLRCHSQLRMITALPERAAQLGPQRLALEQGRAWGALLMPNSGVYLGLKEKGQGGQASTWRESGSPTRPAALAPIFPRPHCCVSPAGRRLLLPTALHPKAQQMFAAVPRDQQAGTDEETGPERRQALLKAHRDEPSPKPSVPGLCACFTQQELMIAKGVTPQPRSPTAAGACLRRTRGVPGQCSAFPAGSAAGPPLHGQLSGPPAQHNPR